MQGEEMLVLSFPQVMAARYLVPLREGGSLPAVIDTAPSGRYVVKFRGAGQGPKALIAELIVAGVARALGLPVPEAAIVDLAEGFGRAEPDPEIQDLLRTSVGPNFGLAFLPGAVGFDAAVDRSAVPPDLAADVVWFDAYLTNPDRTARNPNLLWWQDRLWLIDHGSALYFHHRWDGWEERIHRPFEPIKHQVLLPQAADLAAADHRLRPRLAEADLRQIVAEIPAAWLGSAEPFPNPARHRDAYLRYLTERLHGPRAWLEEAQRARAGG
jgi:hypothetical protein